MPEAALLEPKLPRAPREGPPAGAVRGGGSAGWNLHIPAAHLGVARAAVQRRPNSLQGSIAAVPHVPQNLVGEMRRQLLPAYRVLFTLARRWDDDPAARPQLGHAASCCKLLVLDAALPVADRALRVVLPRFLCLSGPFLQIVRLAVFDLAGLPRRGASDGCTARGPGSLQSRRTGGGTAHSRLAAARPVPAPRSRRAIAAGAPAV